MMLPVLLKKTLEPVIPQGFIIKKSPYHHCLELYPSSEWESEVNKVKELNTFLKETHDFLRKYTAGFRMVELDNAGRLLIPKDLIVFASIKKEVVINGYTKMIEIWDKARYEKVVGDSTMNYAMLADKLFGSSNKGES